MMYGLFIVIRPSLFTVRVISFLPIILTPELILGVRLFFEGWRTINLQSVQVFSVNKALPDTQGTLASVGNVYYTIREEWGKDLVFGNSPPHQLRAHFPQHLQTPQSLKQSHMPVCQLEVWGTGPAPGWVTMTTGDGACIFDAGSYVAVVWKEKLGVSSLEVALGSLFWGTLLHGQVRQFRPSDLLIFEEQNFCRGPWGKGFTELVKRTDSSLGVRERNRVVRTILNRCLVSTQDRETN